MSFISCRKNDDVFDYPSAIFDVVENFGDTTATVVSCVSYSELKPRILIPAKRSWKRCKCWRFFVHMDLMMSPSRHRSPQKISSLEESSKLPGMAWPCKILAGWCCRWGLWNPHTDEYHHLSLLLSRLDEPMLLEQLPSGQFFSPRNGLVLSSILAKGALIRDEIPGRQLELHPPLTRNDMPGPLWDDRLRQRCEEIRLLTFSDPLYSFPPSGW